MGDVKLEAGIVVSCLNVWSQATIGQWLGISLPLTMQKHCVATVANRHQHFVTGDKVFYVNKDRTVLPTVKCLATESQPYYRAYDSGRAVLVGDCNTKHAEHVANMSDDYSEEVKFDNEVHAALLAKERFSNLDAPEVVETWSGCYDTSPDESPVL